MSRGCRAFGPHGCLVCSCPSLRARRRRAGPGSRLPVCRRRWYRHLCEHRQLRHRHGRRRWRRRLVLRLVWRRYHHLVLSWRRLSVWRYRHCRYRQCCCCRRAAATGDRQCRPGGYRPRRRHGGWRRWRHVCWRHRHRRHRHAGLAQAATSHRRHRCGGARRRYRHGRYRRRRGGSGARRHGGGGTATSTPPRRRPPPRRARSAPTAIRRRRAAPARRRRRGARRWRRVPTAAASCRCGPGLPGRREPTAAAPSVAAVLADQPPPSPHFLYSCQVSGVRG